MIKDKGEFIEYDVIIEHYVIKTKTKRDTKGKIIKEDGKAIKERIEEFKGFKLIPTSFLKEGITLYGPVTNARNQILKTRSTIFDKFTNKFYIVKHTVPEIEKSLVVDKFESVGFRVGR